MSRWVTVMKSLTLVLHLGLIVSAAVGVGYYFGWLLDNYLGLTETCSVGGIVIGAISGIYFLYREVTAFTEEPPRR